MNLDVKRYSWSLDLSTTNVGMALWDGQGKLIELKHLQLDIDKQVSQEDRYLHKAEMFKNYVIDYKKKIESKYACVIENVFIEKPLPNTKINIDTTAMLLGFNGIACYILWQTFGFPPTQISVHDSRKLFCPELIKSKTVKKRNGTVMVKETLSFPKNIDKKEYIFKKVRKLEPGIQWIYGVKSKEIKKESFDMSDAYCVGYAGLKLKNIL